MTQEDSALPVQRTSPPAVAVFFLALLRIAVGWHFLYEGILKLLDPDWTAAGFLRASTGPLAHVFQRLAADETLLRVVNLLNVWGLILIGACLMLGLLTRLAAFAGVLLLALYYIAYPPFFQPMMPGVAEGNYLVVSKNLVELLALCAVIALPARALGIDGMLEARRARRRASGPMVALPAHLPTDVPGLAPTGLSRRRILTGMAGLPFIGAFVLSFLKKHGWPGREERYLANRADAYTGATIKTFDFSKTVADIKGQLPQGQIGNVKLSRMMLGGNLIGGWAHARDLIYVSKLIKAYHHREKVFETFRLAEACGVNTIITNPILCEIISDYWRSTGGKIQFISDCGGKDVLEMTQKSIDTGACACYVHGGIADSLVAKGEFDLFEKALELIRRSGLPAGIAGHRLRTVAACVEKGILPDFWMKTLHHTDYWSAKPEPECDNTWCDDPAGTIAFMESLPQPWIAYKVLAAGAIAPQQGFRYAFTSGADFICVGMYDFQIVEDVNLAFDVLKEPLDRQRPWLA